MWILKWTMKTTRLFRVYRGWNTSHLCGDYSKPLFGSLLNNQYLMERIRVLFCGEKVASHRAFVTSRQRGASKIIVNRVTPPKFNIGPEKWWLEDYFPIGKVTFQGLRVKIHKFICRDEKFFKWSMFILQYRTEISWFMRNTTPHNWGLCFMPGTYPNQAGQQRSPTATRHSMRHQHRPRRGYRYLGWFHARYTWS